MAEHEPKAKKKLTIAADYWCPINCDPSEENPGIGIDMERNRDKIFGLYQRFHNHPDSKGLGLYLVKSQVETMGGTIEVDSKVGKGTTFTITFNN